MNWILLSNVPWNVSNFWWFKINFYFAVNQGYEGYDGPHEPEEYMGPMDPNPAQFVAVENRAPDFFWRPMRSVNHNFLIRPTRASPNAKKSQVKTKDFFWRPMRSVNQFLVRPTRIPTASDAKKSDFFFMRPMKREYFVVRRSGEYQPKRQNPFWVRPTRASPM